MKWAFHPNTNGKYKEFGSLKLFAKKSVKYPFTKRMINPEELYGNDDVCAGVYLESSCNSSRFCPADESRIFQDLE